MLKIELLKPTYTTNEVPELYYVNNIDVYQTLGFDSDISLHIVFSFFPCHNDDFYLLFRLVLRQWFIKLSINTPDNTGLPFVFKIVRIDNE